MMCRFFIGFAPLQHSVKRALPLSINPPNGSFQGRSPKGRGQHWQCNATPCTGLVISGLKLRITLCIGLPYENSKLSQALEKLTQSWHHSVFGFPIRIHEVVPPPTPAGIKCIPLITEYSRSKKHKEDLDQSVCVCVFGQFCTTAHFLGIKKLVNLTPPFPKQQWQI